MIFSAKFLHPTGHLVSHIDNSFPNCPVEFFTFPGGEPHCKIDPKEFYSISADSGISLELTVRFSCFEDMGYLILFMDILRRNRAMCRAKLVCPYLPGARQDRGVPLTCKMYADLINSCKFDEVIAVDPHSDVMPALLNNFRAVSLKDVVSNYVENGGKIFAISDINLSTVIIPDTGAIKRATEVAKYFGIPTAQAIKTRDFKTGHLSGFRLVEPIETSRAIMVDDICDGGGTFIGLAKAIKERYPDLVLDLLVTHGIFSKGFSELHNYFENIICTDSFLNGGEDVTLLSLYHL